MPVQLTMTEHPDLDQVQALLYADTKQPHIHLVDMPYRLTSTWQDEGCLMGLWQREGDLLAWAVFQPPWWNLDYVLHPSVRGTSLEAEVLAWGHSQILEYAQRTGEKFYGSVEFFEDTPHADYTRDCLQRLGFQPFAWSTCRFELSLHPDIPQLNHSPGFTIRPLRGKDEVEAYVELHRAAFNSEKMTTAWRLRTLEHPAYNPNIDLVLVGPDDIPVGFCVCWLFYNQAQIEPLGVHPDYQGRGIGRGLELTTLHTLGEQGATSVVVDHVSLNDRAIALSLQTGFKQTNNARRYYIDAG